MQTDFNVTSIVENYTNWLKEEMRLREYEKGYGVTTPFLNNANDYIEIYIDTTKNDIILTDDGDTLFDLEMSGFTLTPSREKILSRILDKFGVNLENNIFYKKTTQAQFPQSKHLFIQAILSVNDMLQLSRPSVTSMFLDDVKYYFAENDIYYVPDPSFTGISGFSHSYDFVFQGNQHKPTRYAKAINNLNRQQVESFVFSWNDVSQKRDKNSQAIAIINDQNIVPENALAGFQKLDIKTLEWSKRGTKEFRELVS